MTVGEIARTLVVSRSTAVRHVNAAIAAGYTGFDRTTPGGHRRVLREAFEAHMRRLTQAAPVSGEQLRATT